MFIQEEEQQEEFTHPPLPQLQFKMTPEQNFVSKHLVIASYGTSSIFVASFLDTEKPLSKINFVKAKQKSLANVYADSDTTYLVFNDELQKMKEIHLSRFINKYFKYESVIALTQCARGLLQKSINGNMMYISTTQYPTPNCPKFQQGWSGPQADVLTHCQIMKIPMICYIGIIDEYQIEKQGVRQIFGFLQGKSSFEKAKYDNAKEIKKFNMIKNSNKLYL